jgi:hypothetical protein
MLGPGCLDSNVCSATFQLCDFWASRLTTSLCLSFALLPFFFFLWFVWFSDRVSLCSWIPGWPGNAYFPPASASKVMGLQVCATMSGLLLFKLGITVVPTPMLVLRIK